MGSTAQLPFELDLSANKRNSLMTLIFVAIFAVAFYTQRESFASLAATNALAFNLVKFGPILLAALGLWVLMKAVFGLTTKKHARFEGDKVTVESSSILRNHNWSEPIAAFEGVRWRKHVTSRTNSSSSSSSQSILYQIVELKHENSSRCIALNVRRTNSRNSDWSESRQQLEHFAKLFHLPVLDERDGTVHVRAAEDLDKSIKDLAEEGKIDAEWDDSADLPAGISMARESDGAEAGVQSLVVEIQVLRAPIWLYGLFMVAGALVLLSSLLPFIFFGALVGIALIGAPILLIKFERKNPRTITVTRSRLEATNPSQGGASGKNVAMHKDIESVEVRKRSDIAALGKELLISSDQGEFRIGKGLSNEALEWMRKLIVSAIAKA